VLSDVEKISLAAGPRIANSPPPNYYNRRRWNLPAPPTQTASLAHRRTADRENRPRVSNTQSMGLRVFRDAHRDRAMVQAIHVRGDY